MVFPRDKINSGLSFLKPIITEQVSAMWTKYMIQVLYFSDYKTHFLPPRFGRKMEGASYSPNAVYQVPWGEGGSGGTGVFSYFPPLKPRYIWWSGASYSPKNMVCKQKVWFELENQHGIFCWLVKSLLYHCTPQPDSSTWYTLF